MLGFGILRQGRVYLRDLGFNDLRYGVASAGIRYLIKRGNYLVGIYLPAIPRSFRSLVISSSSMNIIELLLLLILLILYFLYLYAISLPWYIYSNSSNYSTF